MVLYDELAPQKYLRTHIHKQVIYSFLCLKYLHSGLIAISVIISAVVVHKKTKPRTRKESSDVEYKAKTKSVRMSRLNSHRYSSEGRPRRASPLKIATELTTGVGSEQFYEKPEPMYEPFGKM